MELCAMLTFFFSSTAELNRTPNDIAEAESEIVAGFHTEYSGMKFGWFYASELLHAFTFGGFIAGSCGCAPTSPLYSVLRLNARSAMRESCPSARRGCRRRRARR